MLSRIKSAFNLKLNIQSNESKHVKDLDDRLVGDEVISILGYDYKITNITHSIGGLRTTSVELYCIGNSKLTNGEENER